MKRNGNLFRRIIEKARRQSLTFLPLSFGRVSMQWPYILNGKVWPSSILFGDDKASLKTSVESVEPSFDNPPVIHQDEFPTLAKKNEQIFCYKGKSLSEALLFAEHGENMLCTKIVLNVRNNFCTQHRAVGRSENPGVPVVIRWA